MPKSTRRPARQLRAFRQLLICLALFLTLFLGKGVFPHRMEQAGSQLLDYMARRTDLDRLLTTVGRSLKQGDPLEELGDFCLSVFGPEQDQPAVPAAAWAQSDPRLVLNRSDLPASLRYLNFEPAVPEPVPEPVQEPVQEPASIPAVGTVLMAVDYDGPTLPDNHTMHKLSLGALQTAPPLSGTLWSPYGYRDHPIDGQFKFHNGVDLGAAEGTPIAAFAAGTVEYVGKSDVFGNYLQLDHGGGVKSFYAHCSKLEVSTGQQVALGQTVALVGQTGAATGPHLHFEVKCAGQYVDPAYYL